MDIFTYDKRAPHLYKNNNKDYNVGVEGEDSCSKQGGKTMSNNNTISKWGYIFDHIFWGVLSMVWFNNILFRNVDGLTFNQSRLFLLLALIVSATLGIVFTWEKRRNNLSLFVNIIMPYELYSFISYRHTAPVLMWSLAALSLLLSITYMVLIFKPNIRATARKKAIIRTRLIKSFLGTQTVGACCMTVMILVLGVSSFFGILCFSPSEEPAKRSNSEAVTIANNIEVVSQLEEDKWSTLSTAEKLNTLQTVANIEVYYLGLPHELNVIAGPLSENTLACYNDRTHVITINIDHLESDSAHDILDSVCHEARHAYQHRLCDVYDSVSDEQKELLVFYNVQMYKQEFSSYVDGKDDAIGYYFQWCESDSRSYAREAVIDYYSKIETYLEKEVP